MASTSYTHPPQVPPLTRCSAAQSRVSSGRSGSGARSGRGERRGQHLRAFLGAESSVAVADEVDAAFELVAVDDDLDAVAVAHLADRAAGQRLRADVADAGAGRDAGEAGVGQHRDVLAEAADA